MLVKKILTILENFPKRHFVTLLFGMLLLITFIILGNFNFSDQKKDYDLSKEIDIEILEREIRSEPIYTSKETVIKRNDSLFTILNNFGVKNENIISLINSKNSNLLSNIEIGDKIKVNLDESNEIKDLLYIDDFQSGVRAERFEDTYKINKFLQELKR